MKLDATRDRFAEHRPPVTVVLQQSGKPLTSNCTK